MQLVVTGVMHNRPLVDLREWIVGLISNGDMLALMKSILETVDEFGKPAE